MCGHRPRTSLSFDDAVKHHSGITADCNHHKVVSPLQSSSLRKGAIIGGGEFKACPCCSRYIETFDKVAVSSTARSRAYCHNTYAREQKSERKAKRLGMDVLLNDMKEEKMKLEARRPMSPTGRRSSSIGLPPRVSPPR